jgi:hypothetical protein
MKRIKNEVEEEVYELRSKVETYQKYFTDK